MGVKTFNILPQEPFLRGKGQLNSEQVSTTVHILFVELITAPISLLPLTHFVFVTENFGQHTGHSKIDPSNLRVSTTMMT